MRAQPRARPLSQCWAAPPLGESQEDAAHSAGLAEAGDRMHAREEGKFFFQTQNFMRAR